MRDQIYRVGRASCLETLTPGRSYIFQFLSTTKILLHLERQLLESLRSVIALLSGTLHCDICTMSSRQTQRRTSKMYTLEATATSAQSSPVPSISENQSAPDRPTRRVLFKRSSASSKLSITPSIFDKDDSTNSPELSPITPPEDPSEPLGNTPESNHGIFAESPDLKLSVAKQRRSRKKTRTYIAGPSRAQDAISQHTPSRSSRHHSWR